MTFEVFTVVNIMAAVLQNVRSHYLVDSYQHFLGK
jgi:hypothetical protein